MYDTTNIFAKIIKADLKCDKIYEDDDIISFYDINPQAPVHALVLPKQHYIDYADFLTKASSQNITHFFVKVEHITKLLKLESFRLITNQGVKSGQSIFHFHLHILGGRIMDNLV